MNTKPNENYSIKLDGIPYYNNDDHVWNQFGVRGVTRRKNGRYRSTISFKGKRIHLGNFSNKEEAAEAYDKKAIELFVKGEDHNDNKSEQ